MRTTTENMTKAITSSTTPSGPHYEKRWETYAMIPFVSYEWDGEQCTDKCDPIWIDKRMFGMFKHDKQQALEYAKRWTALDDEEQISYLELKHENWHEAFTWPCDLMNEDFDPVMLDDYVLEADVIDFERLDYAEDALEDVEREHREVFDGIPGEMLGEYAWQLDEQVVIEMLTKMDWDTGRRVWLFPDEMPEWEEVEECATLPCDEEGIEHLTDWYCARSDSPLFDIDVDAALYALTECDEDGRRFWRSLTDSQVEEALYDAALLTAENLGPDVAAAYELENDPEGMWEIADWADVWVWADDTPVLLTMWKALTSPTYHQWLPLTRKRVREVIEGIMA